MVPGHSDRGSAIGARRHLATKPVNPPNVLWKPGRKDTVTYRPPKRCSFRYCKARASAMRMDSSPANAPLVATGRIQTQCAQRSGFVLLHPSRKIAMIRSRRSSNRWPSSVSLNVLEVRVTIPTRRRDSRALRQLPMAAGEELRALAAAERLPALTTFIKS